MVVVEGAALADVGLLCLAPQVLVLRQVELQQEQMLAESADAPAAVAGPQASQHGQPGDASQQLSAQPSQMLSARSHKGAAAAQSEQGSAAAAPAAAALAAGGGAQAAAAAVAAVMSASATRALLYQDTQLVAPQRKASQILLYRCGPALRVRSTVSSCN